jgi:dihydroxy-acid dehydratase
MKKEVNKYSKTLTQQKKQGASQAMLYATGLKEEDLDKAQVGISSVWYEGNPCNMHLMDLAAEVKKGVQDAGMVGYRFNTIGVSDGISMGTDGMSYSLQSRDLIADSIETVMGGQWYDGNIALPGCDKNMPGTVIAMARHNRPSMMVYGRLRQGWPRQRLVRTRCSRLLCWQVARSAPARRRTLAGRSSTLCRPSSPTASSATAR